MDKNVNFPLSSPGILSSAFKNKGIHSFQAACHYVTLLPYKRNSDKEDPQCVLRDQFGTCSTKHALLARLAEENAVTGIKLMLGMFKMQASNTPQVARRLSDNGLEYIPEAHNYLMPGADILDCTKPNFLNGSLKQYLVKEMEIQPHEVTDVKVAIHKEFLRSWLAEQAFSHLTFEQLWAIREGCITDLFTE